jgi:hypothetical protein
LRAVKGVFKVSTKGKALETIILFFAKLAKSISVTLCIRVAACN